MNLEVGDVACLYQHECMCSPTVAFMSHDTKLNLLSAALVWTHVPQGSLPRLQYQVFSAQPSRPIDLSRLEGHTQ